MECAVAHLAGRVQWVMDGFALGFQARIPGYPRYSVVGNTSVGEFHLRISNASLDDDAQFQCQVTPYKHHKAIRAAANLTVLAPPTSITMLNHVDNSKLEVKEKQEVSLECITSGSKPATVIAWYRGKDQLKLDKKEEKIVSDKKRRSAWSRIVLSPSAEDDGVTYSCEAQHEALPPDQRLRASVQLSVLYPPSVPFIEGYMKGESVLRGQTVELTCRSKSGNPPAQLVWYKNGEQVSMEYRTNGKSSENTFTFTATEEDDKAVFLCEASNIMSPTPLSSQVQLNVFYASREVKISGRSEALVGASVGLTCRTGASNPATSVAWTVAGEAVPAAWTRATSEAGPRGGFVSVSNVTVPLRSNKTLVVICHARNHQLNEHLIATHSIAVLSVPEKPVISGYARGTDLAAGSVLRLSCTVLGGNPLPIVTWFKNGQKIQSTMKVQDQTTVSEVAVLLSNSDNQAVYTCEANNSATEKPLSESVLLSVFFPPSYVQIKQEPEVLRIGTKATLICESGASNPPAELSWWRNDVPVGEEVVFDRETERMHGGVAASIHLPITITADSDGVTYTCQATNLPLERSIHHSHTLQVVYKPVFIEMENQRKGLEGEPFAVMLKVRAHPPVLTYTWTKNGSPVNSSFINGSTISFEKLDRQDEGIYTCEAINSEGSAFFSFHLEVQYPATIMSVSENIEAGHGENVSLVCGLEGNPLKTDHVAWRRRGHLLKSGATKTFVNSTSILIIQNITREDYGEYECIVDNGLGKLVQKAVHLFFKHKPEIELSPQLTKAASHIGNTAQLLCHASAAPKPKFTWNRVGSPLAINTTEKYQVFFYQLVGTKYLSKLLVTNVEGSDYGNYNCVVRNVLGYSSSVVKLTQPSIPDAPLNFRVVNFTQTSVMLAWLPGFDGGDPADFQIRFRQAHSSNLMDSYHKVPSNVSQTIISGLRTGTEYIFSIRAINKYGTSRFYSDTIKGVTLSPTSAFSLSAGKINGDRSLLFLGLGVGTMLLLINAVLLGCCLYKRSEKFTGGKEKQVSGKTNSLEMFTSPSLFTGTGTTETLSSISEKSETFTDPNPDITNENRKIAATMCHRFQNSYAGHYPYLNWNCEYSFGTMRRGQRSPNRDTMPVESPYCHSLSRTKLVHDSLHRYPGVGSHEVFDHEQTLLPLHYFVPPGPLPPPPPDVTVLSNHNNPQPPLSSFSFNNLNVERHFM
ncbi:unnamed protein product [Bemisia tabaci]|uniref:Nephrin n=1 Tax=Bemisia tabaci TaxID=7038 RepID=A0A9P0A1Y8_BEMTA|nr:unnamed protein product [Bemisia tabaci]